MQLTVNDQKHLTIEPKDQDGDVQLVLEDTAREEYFFAFITKAEARQVVERMLEEYPDLKTDL